MASFFDSSSPVTESPDFLFKRLGTVRGAPDLSDFRVYLRAYAPVDADAGDVTDDEPEGECIGKIRVDSSSSFASVWSVYVERDDQHVYIGVGPIKFADRLAAANALFVTYQVIRPLIQANALFITSEVISALRSQRIQSHVQSIPALC